MNTLENGMSLSIIKSYYNKTRVGKDGITQTVDTSHNYPLYMLQLSKTYLDEEDKAKVIEQIINDLKTTEVELQNLLAKENESDGR